MKRIIELTFGRILLEETDGYLVRSVWTTLNLCSGGKSLLLDEAEKQIREYLAGRRQIFNLPINHRGTSFQEKVWKELCKIPYGSTATYGSLAKAIGCSGGSRAVAQACSRNKLCIVIPCHRVVSKTGLGGYTAPEGVLTKSRLLLVEKNGQ